MTPFAIEPNHFLDQAVEAFYHTDFFGWKKPNNPDYLNILKNDNHHNWSNSQLRHSMNQLRVALTTDLPQILESLQLDTITVCVIPRSKADRTYRANQLLFKSTVRTVVNELEGFVDGTGYISRHTNTKTTHLRREIIGYVNDGESPYRGITTNTCNISNNIRNQDILLIDDIYTRTVNIDEDAIQSMLDNHAKSVAFYAIGNTVGNHF